MRITNVLVIITVAISFLVQPGWALPPGFSFRSEVSNTQPEIGERITYTITLTGPATSLPDIAPPEFDGLDVVAGPSLSTSVQIINAQITSTKTLTYILRPNRTGIITINPAYFNYKGRKYLSNDITLKVQDGGGASSSRQTSPSSQAPSPPPSTTYGEVPEVLLIAQADKTSPYVMEQVTVSYYLYLRVSASNYNLVRVPQATGFFQEEFEVPQRPILEDASVKGVPYKRALIRKVALFPTRPGELTLDPLVCDVTIQKAVKHRQRRDIFDLFFEDPFSPRYRSEVVTVRSEPLLFTVLPHPKEGQPLSFRGDVGEYQLSVEYDKQDVAQNEPLTIKVVIAGKGYIKTLQPPQLNLPSDFERFPPTTEEKFTKIGNSIQGKKIFNYLVIPRRPGKYQLSPVEFSFFEPGTRKYHHIRAGGQSLIVNPSLSQEGARFSFQGDQVPLLEKDIRFIKGATTPLKMNSPPIYQQDLFYLMIAIPPFLFLLGVSGEWLYRWKMSDPLSVRRRRATIALQDAIRSSLKRQKKSLDSYQIGQIGKSFAEFIGAFIGLPSAGLTQEMIKDQLTERGFDSQLKDQIVYLWNELERLRYAPILPQGEEWRALLVQIDEITSKMQKESKK